MSKSLERHRSRTLALALLLAGLAAGAAAFWFAYGEAQEFQDDSLRQIAALAERQVKGPAFEGDAAPDDQESRIIVLHLPQDARPSWVPADITAGFHTLSGAEGRFRVLVRRTPRGGLISVVASPESIRLILSNAMENALKYTQQGGEVTLRLMSEDDHAIVEVVDNGPGIPVAERGRVFDAFYRIPGAIGDGSGLGLSIAADAANRMGGALSLYERRDGPSLIFRYRQRRTG
ncbi:MAG: ATP-binding protein [Betaproteobacteria bacterium]|nr:ATP-binding protein [Betaproteobacteria bacterium]